MYCFRFDFVPLLCFVPSLIHQLEEVVPVYLQLWPTNPERENCLSLKEQILAAFGFFSADKYIHLVVFMSHPMPIFQFLHF